MAIGNDDPLEVVPTMIIVVMVTCPFRGLIPQKMVADLTMATNQLL